MTPRASHRRSFLASAFLVVGAVSADAQTPQWGVVATYIAVDGFALDVADLNLDGRLDAVVVGLGPATIMLGQADGTFQVQTVPSDTGLSGTRLVLGLLDGDSFPDAFTGNSLMHGNGDGTFVQASVQPVGLGGASAVDVGDFNGDGRLDLVASVNGLIRVALADAAGSFYLPFAYASCGYAEYLTVADVDADGDVDVVATCSGGLTVLTNNLPSGFSAQGYGRDAASRVVVGNFTGDAIPDLVAARRLLTGQGGGLFSPGPVMPSLGYGWYEGFDCDGDGLLDFAARSQGAPAVLVARGLGDGTFDATCIVPLTSSEAPAFIRVGNVLGDARPELVVLEGDGGSGLRKVRVLRNLAPDCNGNGIDDPVEIAAGGSTDCNSNGIPDFCEGDCDANGTFDPCQIAANPTEDLDADGVLDICETAGIPLCFGDGSGNPCPCDPGQTGPPGAGCGNSAGSGARLEARGNPSVSLDSVTLRATGIPANAVGLLFQGSGLQAGGLGGTFGDGLLCVNQNVVRLVIRNSVGGALSFGHSVTGDPSVAAVGLVPALGAVRYYQHWYRDPAPFCASGTFNLSNAVQLTWVP